MQQSNVLLDFVGYQEKGFWQNQLMVAEYFENSNSVRRIEMSYDALGRRVKKKVIESGTTKTRKSEVRISTLIILMGKFI